MKAEATAVTAELARLRPEGAIPEIATELLDLLAPGPIRTLVERLRSARMVERVDLAESLRPMVCGPGVLPPAVFPAP